MLESRGALNPPLSGSSLLYLAIALFACFGAAGIGSALTTPGLDPWYAELVKPPLNPPNWIFAPVWSLLFLLMALAVWRVMRFDDQSSREGIQKKRALILFAAQLIINVSWSGTFFYLQSPELALFVIAVFFVSILETTRAFAALDRLASLMFLPYLVWVGFASYLNSGIALLN